MLVEASVTVTNVQTNIVRTTETEASGRYSVPALPPGKYIVTAARSGFTTERREDIDLFLGESVALDFALTIAPAEQTVTVTGEEPLVQTNRTGLSSLVNQQQIDSLPINGRNFISSRSSRRVFPPTTHRSKAPR